MKSNPVACFWRTAGGIRFRFLVYPACPEPRGGALKGWLSTCLSLCRGGACPARSSRITANPSFRAKRDAGTKAGSFLKRRRHGLCVPDGSAGRVTL